MSRSFGAGSPLYFRCAKCRTATARRIHHGDSGGLSFVATGLTREARNKRGSARGSRSSNTAYEYRCLDCGHVGWSRHNDVERKYKQWREQCK